MPITVEDARKLIAQQQVAHKLLAGFYQNLLTSFDRLVAKCGYTFSGWWPALTNRPCQARTNPSSKWIWDFLPLYAATFEYKMQEEPAKSQPGNCVLIFRLFCDEGFRSEYRTGYVDPVDLESKDGCIELMVYRCIKADTKRCSELYDASEWPKPFEDGWQNICPPSMRAYYKRYPLEAFITEHDSIQTHLIDLTSKGYVVPEI
ncbi:MAG: hypothetical protein DELT_02215 [Desulfovibrio sp.]